MSLIYNPLLKYNLQFSGENSINGDFLDVNCSNFNDFQNAVQMGQNATIRLHLLNDISLNSNYSANFDNVQIFGHDHKINLENHTFTIEGQTCYFYQVRFNASSSVSASSAINYSAANIQINSNVNSSRFFFEYTIFMNFICKSSDGAKNIINIKNISGSGSSPSAHLYFMFCETMTNYTNDNINTCTFCVNHNGALHAFTVHQIDYWGNSHEANSTNNFCIVGNSLSGAAKLGWISDGSCFYNSSVTGARTPNMINIYNPSFIDFQNLQNNYTTFKDVVEGLRVMPESTYQSLTTKENNVLYLTY